MGNKQMFELWSVRLRVIIFTPYYLILFLLIPILWVLGFICFGYTWKYLPKIAKVLNRVDDIMFGFNLGEENEY